MNRRYHDKPLWQIVEFTLVWFVALTGCVMFWLWLIGEMMK